MRLVLTHYVPGAPSSDRLHLAIAAALDSAAERIATTRDETVTESIADGVRIMRGVAALDGSELHLSGSDHLTEVRVEVPWSAADAGTSKLWAANRFAGVLADELAPAA